MAEELLDLSEVRIQDHEQDAQTASNTENGDQESHITTEAQLSDKTERNISEVKDMNIDINRENENNEAQETQPLLTQNQVVSEEANLTTVHTIDVKQADEEKTRRTFKEFCCDWDDRRAYYFNRKLGFIFVYVGLGLIIAGIALVWLSTMLHPQIPFAMSIWIGIMIVIVGALIIENSNWQKELDKAEELNIQYEEEKLEEKAKKAKLFYGAAFEESAITDPNGQPVHLTEDEVRQIITDMEGPGAIHSMYSLGGKWQVYFYEKATREEFVNKKLIYKGSDVQPFVIESKTEDGLVALAHLCALEAQEVVLHGYKFENGDVVDDDGRMVKLTEEEVCECILKRQVDPSKLYAVEYIRGDWKIYVYGLATGNKLMQQGLEIRGNTVTIRELKNKVVQPSKVKLRKKKKSGGKKDMSGVAILKILNLPVVVEDHLIVKNLQRAGCKVKGAIQKQRVKRQFEGGSVLFFNGVRLARVRIPSLKKFPLKQVWDGHFVKMEVVRIFQDGDSVDQNAQLDSAITALQLKNSKMPDSNKKGEIVTRATCHVENEIGKEDATSKLKPSCQDMDIGRSRESVENSRETLRPSWDENTRETARPSSDAINGAIGGDEPESIDVAEPVKRINGDSGIQTPETGSRTSVLGLQMSNPEEPPLTQMQQEYLV